MTVESTLSTRAFFPASNSATRFRISMLHAPKRFVGVWKMLTDVAGADRAKQRVGNRMRENIGVRMSLQAARVGDLDAAQNQFQSLGETMDIVTDAGSNHANGLTKH